MNIRSSMKVRTQALVLAILLTLVIPLVPAQAQQPPHKKKPPFYAVTDLGTLGGTFSRAFSINNRGWIAGQANLADDAADHASLWRDGFLSDLGTLGGPSSLAWGLNGYGQVVGQAESPIPDPFGLDFCFTRTQLQCLPFIWQNDAMTALPTLGGNDGLAFAINDLGIAVGQAENSTLDSTCGGPQYEAKPVLWKDGVAQELPTLYGDPDGDARAINISGQAVGASGGCVSPFSPPVHALLWQNGTVTDLGNLGSELYTEAVAINDRGQVVGSSDVPGDDFAGPASTAHGFLWKNGKIRDLGTIPGDAGSFAITLNNKGQAAGIGSRAILWQDGRLIDLNTLVPGEPFSPLYLLQAWDINDREEIAGIGLAVTGELHAFVAIPCSDNEDAESCKGSPALPAAVTANQRVASNGMKPAVGGLLGLMLDRFHSQSFSRSQFFRRRSRQVTQR
jgi:probable HAF family extracellular repeat protein